MHECKESRDAHRLIRASENDNNEQKDCSPCEDNAINFLFDENVTNEQKQIHNVSFEIYEDVDVEKNYNTLSLLQLELEYLTCSSIKTNYVLKVSNLLN